MIERHEQEIGGLPGAWRSAPGDDPPVLWIHGVPDSSEVWEPFLARAGGIAPDLPGFGRSAKRGDLDYSIAGLADWLERFVAHLGLERFSLVMHDWGVVGLALAQRAPERVHRLVAINTVPLLPGYRWHWIARVWRAPLLGEAAMGLSVKPVARRLLPPGRTDAVMAHFDPGTQRAILRLYRASPPDVLAAAGAGLGAVTAPGLVLHGGADRYIPARFADGLAAALGNAEVEHVAGAGHWPWLDRPDLIERVAAFLGAGAEGSRHRGTSAGASGGAAFPQDTANKREESGA
jgi:pimeloyl-ACP methyl ester carboxylesterase